MVSKKRHSLGPWRVEILLVLKENKKLVEEFKHNGGWTVYLRQGLKKKKN